MPMNEKPISDAKISQEIPGFKVDKLEKIEDKNGKVKNRPKIHYCYWCKVPKKKITRHWYDCHSDEEKVKQILEISGQKNPTDQKSLLLRSEKIAMLKNEGDNR